MTFEKLKEEFHAYIQNNEYVSNKNPEVFLNENLDLLESWCKFEESFKNEQHLVIDKEYSFYDMEKKLGRKFDINVNLDNCSFKIFNSYSSDLSRNLKMVNMISAKSKVNKEYTSDLVNSFSLKNQSEFKLLNELSNKDHNFKVFTKLKSYSNNQSNSSFRFWSGRLEINFYIHDVLENKIKPFFAISVQDESGKTSEFLSEFFYQYFKSILDENRTYLQQRLIVLNIIHGVFQNICFQKEDLMDSIPTGSITVEDFISFISDYNEVFILKNDYPLITENTIIELKMASKEFHFHDDTLKKNAININM